MVRIIAKWLILIRLTFSFCFCSFLYYLFPLTTRNPRFFFILGFFEIFLLFFVLFTNWRSRSTSQLAPFEKLGRFGTFHWSFAWWMFMLKLYLKFQLNWSSWNATTFLFCFYFQRLKHKLKIGKATSVKPQKHAHLFFPYL